MQIQNVIFEQALILPEEETTTIQLVLSPETQDPPPAGEEQYYRFQVFSLNTASRWISHVTGQLMVDSSEEQPDAAERVDLAELLSQCPTEFSVADHYQVCRERGLNYSADFQSIEQVSAPFPALVIDRLVGPGDFVSIGTPLAHLVSLDRVEIRVPLSVGQWLIVDATPNRRVEVRTQSGANWPGYVLRAERHIDTADRQRALVIAVDLPLEQRPPLYPGTFVTALLPSKPIESAYLLPASALDTNGYLWRIDTDNHVWRLKPRASHRFDDVVVVVPPETMDEATIVVKPLASLTPGTLRTCLRSI